MYHWTLQDTYYIRPCYQDRELQQLYLIHRNKHREAAKMRRQRNTAQMKDQNSRKRTKQNGDKQSIRYRVQNTGYGDAQITL